MVRNLVGCLVKIGNGSQPLDWLVEVAESRDRTRAAPTFAAAGLYLSGVEYDAHWGLPGSPSSTAEVLRRSGIAALLPV
jgi:tRNA pseudouridine38-40 synthase